MDIPFWQGFLALSALAAVFLIWPTIFVHREKKRELLTDEQAEVNRGVYTDQIDELEQTHLRGEIESGELQQLKQDLEATLTADAQSGTLQSEKPIIASFKSRLPVIALSLALPIFALIFYGAIGAKADWDIYQLALKRAHAENMQERATANESLMVSLQTRLEHKPNNSQSWYLLATVASELGDYDEAVRAFRRVLEIEPNAPQVIAELAQALFLRAGNTITPEVSKNTQLALQLNPSIPTALGLAGIEAFQSGAYQAAIDHWSMAIAQLDPKSSASVALSSGIERAQQALSKSGKVKPNKNNSDDKGPEISVSVSMDGAVVTANPDDYVFVYARAWHGPKMPLAIRKLKVSDLPIKITLDKSMSMAPGMDLGSFPQIELVARISGSGSAIPQPGDWQVSAGPIIVAEHTDAVSLVIAEQLD